MPGGGPVILSGPVREQLHGRLELNVVRPADGRPLGQGEGAVGGEPLSDEGAAAAGAVGGGGQPQPAAVGQREGDLGVPLAGG